MRSPFRISDLAQMLVRMAPRKSFQGYSMGAVWPAAPAGPGPLEWGIHRRQSAGSSGFFESDYLLGDELPTNQSFLWVSSPYRGLTPLIPFITRVNRFCGLVLTLVVSGLNLAPTKIPLKSPGWTNPLMIRGMNHQVPTMESQQRKLFGKFEEWRSTLDARDIFLGHWVCPEMGDIPKWYKKWKTGWWLGHPSEKYEFVNWDD